MREYYCWIWLCNGRGDCAGKETWDNRLMMAVPVAFSLLWLPDVTGLHVPVAFDIDGTAAIVVVLFVVSMITRIDTPVDDLFIMTIAIDTEMGAPINFILLDDTTKVKVLLRLWLVR